jgi:dihydroorotate dehydrogenase subfamily 2
MYKGIIKPILFLFSPELVHNFFISLGRLLGTNPATRSLISLIYNRRDYKIGKIVDGVYYRSPVLLSAGFDYNGHLSQILPCIGFGGEEVGSITAKPYLGNPKPRLTRLPNTKSILVNKGLKNEGVDVVLKRLGSKKLLKDFVIGISIARTNDKTTASTETGIVDYLECFQKVVASGLGSYYTINISCPNTFGGEPFTTPDLLKKLFIALDDVSRTKPLYVKMPITISDNVFTQLLGVLSQHNVQGVIIGNLQKDYSYIDERDIAPSKYCGGLSGTPCRERSNQLIKMTKDEYGDRFTIIGVGGIFSPEDALEKIALGADLLQLITGLIYEGPGLIGRINQSLALQKTDK